jgi:hypothetical protein
MDDEEERESVLSWLFGACFGRKQASDEEIGSAIHRLGTINRRLQEDDD